MDPGTQACRSHSSGIPPLLLSANTFCFCRLSSMTAPLLVFTLSKEFQWHIHGEEVDRGPCNRSEDNCALNVGFIDLGSPCVLLVLISRDSKLNLPALIILVWRCWKKIICQLSFSLVKYMVNGTAGQFFCMPSKSISIH